MALHPNSRSIEKRTEKGLETGWGLSQWMTCKTCSGIGDTPLSRLTGKQLRAQSAKGSKPLTRSRSTPPRNESPPNRPERATCSVATASSCPKNPWTFPNRVPLTCCSKICLLSFTHFCGTVIIVDVQCKQTPLRSPTFVLMKMCLACKSATHVFFYRCFPTIAHELYRKAWSVFQTCFYGRWTKPSKQQLGETARRAVSSQHATC